MAFLIHLFDWGGGWIPSAIRAVILFAAIAALGVGLHRLAVRTFSKRGGVVRNVLERTRRLILYMILVFAAGAAISTLPLSQAAATTVHHLFVALFIIQFGWAAGVAANLAIDHYVQGLDLAAKDNLMARKAATQMRIFRQAINVMAALLTAAFALMSFDAVRQLGVSIFAGAGIAGIVAGMAARPMLENLIAGVQLALTQPLRLEDAVVIDNEWGWVEEINSTYIVVRLWDWRRQVVPLTYLFQNPFTNWTRSSSSLIGTVLLYADYTLPIEAVRARATEIVKASRLWDGVVVNVQVTDAKDHAIEVRVLASASDSSRTWDLRCEIREKLIGYIQDTYPECLPRVRREDFRARSGGHPELAPPETAERTASDNTIELPSPRPRSRG